jgi:DNA-binding winged helix-turn-helix (wHTH) protein/TolB-like protein
VTSLIKIGKWHYNDQSGELVQDSKTVRLPNQQHALLSLLISHGQNGLTSREQIIEALWPRGRVVEYDQSLNACMRKLRLALEDDSQNPHYIETIPGKGYRFVADISDVSKPRFKIYYAAIGLGILCFIGVLALFKGEHKSTVDAPTLAILPVLYLQSGQEDSKSHPSAIALREELLAQLSRTPTQELIVLAPNSVDKLEKSQQVEQASVYQLIGTMRQDPLNFRIDVRLTNHLQQQLWSESFVHTNGAGMPAFQTMARDIILGVSHVLGISPVSAVTPQVALSPSDLMIYNDALYLASQFSN